jgi:hypothetical protein
MKQAWVDFRAIKSVISMEMALAHYGVMLHRLDRCYVRGHCPLPTHASASSRQSFIVNTEKNAWACHSNSCTSARGGRVGGNVLDFVAWMENCSIRDAALRLDNWFSISGEKVQRDTGAVAQRSAPSWMQTEPPDAAP